MNARIIDAKDFIRPELVNKSTIEETVKTILQDIQENGDSSVNYWSQKIDGQKAQLISLKPFEEYDLTSELSQSIKFAYNRIKTFCKFQIKNLNNDSFKDNIGEFGYIYQPIERIGAYIPGGKFPLISTALMTLTPAQVANCPVRIACSPSAHPALLAAASLAGATEFLHLGGAQAIGALSFGFERIKPVNMIAGPGNAYVNTAKAQVQHHTKIDTLAGPSELLIFANELKNPDWIVLDALAQAEHDPNAISLVVSTSQQLLENIYTLTKSSKEGASLLEKEQILFILTESNDQAIELINDYTPEHLLVCDPEFNTSQLTNYGSLFIGENSAVAFGDYCAGPNHTLPTNGAGKNSGGLSVHQFLKVLSTQRVSDTGISELAKYSAALAQAEGLIFHQQSCEVRN